MKAPSVRAGAGHSSWLPLLSISIPLLLSAAPRPRLSSAPAPGDPVRVPWLQPDAEEPHTGPCPLSSLHSASAWGHHSSSSLSYTGSSAVLCSMPWAPLTACHTTPFISMQVLFLSEPALVNGGSQRTQQGAPRKHLGSQGCPIWGTAG